MSGFNPGRSDTPCELCRHFGGWVATQVAGVTKYDTHGWCLDSQGGIAQPDYGCAYWSAAPDPDDYPKVTTRVSA